MSRRMTSGSSLGTRGKNKRSHSEYQARKKSSIATRSRSFDPSDSIGSPEQRNLKNVSNSFNEANRPKDCVCGPNIYGNLLGPTVDEQILAGLAALFKMCDECPPKQSISHSIEDSPKSVSNDQSLLSERRSVTESDETYFEPSPVDDARSSVATEGSSIDTEMSTERTETKNSSVETDEFTNSASQTQPPNKMSSELQTEGEVEMSIQSLTNESVKSIKKQSHQFSNQSQPKLCTCRPSETICKCGTATKCDPPLVICTPEYGADNEAVDDGRLPTSDPKLSNHLSSHHNSSHNNDQQQNNLSSSQSDQRNKSSPQHSRHSANESHISHHEQCKCNPPNYSCKCGTASMCDPPTVTCESNDAAVCHATCENHHHKPHDSQHSSSHKNHQHHSLHGSAHSRDKSHSSSSHSSQHHKTHPGHPHAQHHTHDHNTSHKLRSQSSHTSPKVCSNSPKCLKCRENCSGILHQTHSSSHNSLHQHHEKSSDNHLNRSKSKSSCCCCHNSILGSNVSTKKSAMKNGNNCYYDEKKNDSTSTTKNSSTSYTCVSACPKIKFNMFGEATKDSTTSSTCLSICAISKCSLKKTPNKRKLAAPCKCKNVRRSVRNSHHQKTCGCNSSSTTMTDNCDDSEATSKRQDGDTKAREVRYAITKITKFSSYTTFEIMKSTRKKPKVMPTKMEGVFVLRNKKCS